MSTDDGIEKWLRRDEHSEFKEGLNRNKDVKNEEPESAFKSADEALSDPWLKAK